MAYSDMKKLLRNWLKGQRPTNQPHQNLGLNTQPNLQPTVTTNGFPVYDLDPITDSVAWQPQNTDRQLNQDLIELFKHLKNHYTTDDLLDGIQHVKAFEVLYDSTYAKLAIQTTQKYLINLALQSMLDSIQQIGDQLSKEPHTDLKNYIQTLADHGLKDAMQPLRNQFKPELRPTFDEHIDSIIQKYDFNTWYRSIVKYQFGAYLTNQIQIAFRATQPFEEMVVQLHTIDSVVNLLYLANHLVTQINTQTIRPKSDDDLFMISDLIDVQVGLTTDIVKQCQNLNNQLQLKHPDVVFKNPLIDLGIDIDRETFQKLLTSHEPMLEYQNVLIDHNRLVQYEDQVGIGYLGCVVYGTKIETKSYDQFLTRIDHVYGCYEAQGDYNDQYQNEPNYWIDNIRNVDRPYFRLRSQNILDHKSRKEA